MESVLDSDLVLLLVFSLPLGPVFNSWSVFSFVKWDIITYLTIKCKMPQMLTGTESLFYLVALLSSRIWLLLFQPSCLHSRWQEGESGAGEGPSLPTFWKLHAPLPCSSCCLAWRKLFVPEPLFAAASPPGVRQICLLETLTGQWWDLPRVWNDRCPPHSSFLCTPSGASSC